MNTLWVIHVAVTSAFAFCSLILCIVLRSVKDTDAYKRILLYTRIFMIITAALALCGLIRCYFEILATLDRIESL